MKKNKETKPIYEANTNTCELRQRVPLHVCYSCCWFLFIEWNNKKQPSNNNKNYPSEKKNKN